MQSTFTAAVTNCLLSVGCSTPSSWMFLRSRNTPAGYIRICRHVGAVQRRQGDSSFTDDAFLVEVMGVDRRLNEAHLTRFHCLKTENALGCFEEGLLDLWGRKILSVESCFNVFIWNKVGITVAMLLTRMKSTAEFSSGSSARSLSVSLQSPKAILNLRCSSDLSPLALANQ